MDVHLPDELSSHPQPAGGALVPFVFDAELLDEEEKPDRFDFLWQCFRQLAWLFLLALAAIHRLRREVLELRCQAGYWQALHQRAVQREAKLKATIDYLNGRIRTLNQRLYGKRAESSSATKMPAHGQSQATAKPRRARGQQPGSKGHGRRNNDQLPTSHEPCTLPDEQRCCPDCHCPYEEIAGTADGDILEIEVRAHRRRYHRQRYRRCCQCPGRPAIITAPPPDKLIPKSNLGISLWALLLQRKFAFFLPLHRLLAELRGHDLSLSAGTIIGGLQKLAPLFEPLYQLLVEHNRQEQHWHCDETRWLVFVERDDKANFIWYLWVFAAQESVVFVLDPTRAHDVPEKHFGADAQGIGNVDRYSAYKAMAQVKEGRIALAFCWAHVRRDFLVILTGWPELADWAWSWVEAIGLLYHRNDQRLLANEEPTASPEAKAEAERLLREQVEHMRQRCDTELAQPQLRSPQRKALESLREHWPGLTLFVDNPHVPMDNNVAERRLRGPVVARKNFYGSGSLWSGRLAAILFSLFQTVQLWDLDLGKWLTAYLTTCAKAKGQPPPDPQRYLPWNMTDQERDELRPAINKPPGPEPPSAATSTPE